MIIIINKARQLSSANRTSDPLLLLVQGARDILINVLRFHIGRKSFDGLPFTVHQEFSEVPTDISRENRFKILVKSVLLGPVHLDLMKERKGHAVIRLAERL